MIVTVVAGLNECYHGSRLFACCLGLKKAWSLCCVYFWETGPLSQTVPGGLTVRIGGTFSWNLLKRPSPSLQSKHSRHQLFLLSVSHVWRHVCLCLSSLCHHWSQTPSAGFPLSLYILLLLVTVSCFLPVVVVTMVAWTDVNTQQDKTLSRLRLSGC